MDLLDYLILSELLKDARMSFLSIAKKLGASPYTVGRRYEKMKENGIILRSVISVDLSKLGYQGKAFLMVTTVPNGDKKGIMNTLKGMRNIITVSEILGAFDIIAVAAVSDIQSIRAMVKDIKKIPSVQQVKITCIEDLSFPINSSYGEIISKKCLHLAELEANSRKKTS